MFKSFAVVLLLSCGTSWIHAQANESAAPDLGVCSAAGVEALQKWYVPDTGQWKTTNWWNAANATTMLVRYSRLTGSPEIKSAIANTFTRNSGKDFLNQYWDDEGWWALAWIDAYEWFHDERYLDMAERIFEDMKLGWDDTCGGGIWWRKDRRYKNAIPNELFLSVAARLAVVARDKDRPGEYLDWAKREWQWFAKSGMINADGLINDGLTADCQNNKRTTWTYNQGVILGGLSTLAGATGDVALLERAQAIASAAIARLSDKDGILHESCEPKCGADGVQFKGIFARNLGVLNSAAPSPKFRAFLEANAARICRVQTPEHGFGVVWSAPSETVTAATQVSALDAILAAVTAAAGN
jgi:predicted alpha-1,6-mannanase (GH76 family)